MEKRLNYRKLLENWMLYYHLPPETAEKMFEMIWTRAQASKEKTGDKGAGQNEANME